jgi:hypothetical protein
MISFSKNPRNETQVQNEEEMNFILTFITIRSVVMILYSSQNFMGKRDHQSSRCFQSASPPLTRSNTPDVYQHRQNVSGFCNLVNMERILAHHLRCHVSLEARIRLNLLSTIVTAALRSTMNRPCPLYVPFLKLSRYASNSGCNGRFIYEAL